MDMQSRIDWITYTYHHIDGWELGLPTFAWDDIGEKIRPLPHYATAYKLLPAGRVDIANTEKQGVMVTFTGSDMGELMAAGVEIQKLLEQIATLGNATRLDFAIDVTESRYAIEPLWQEVEMLVANGAYKASGKPAARIADKTKGGYTQYFGSYKSDKFIRVYDKATESGLLLEAMKQHIVCDHWTRTEMVTRGDYAPNFLNDCLEHGYKRAGAAWVRKALDFPLSDRWQEMLSVGASMSLTKLKKPVSRWQKWMDTDVISSITKHAANKDDREFLLQWLSIVTNTVWNYEHGSPDES